MICVDSKEFKVVWGKSLILPFNTAFNTAIQSSKYVLQFSQIIELFASNFWVITLLKRPKNREMCQGTNIAKLSCFFYFH